MDFAVNEDVLTEAAAKCTEAAGKIEGLVDEIYNGIGDPGAGTGLAAAWGGDSYNEFHSTCQKYKASMQMLSAILKAYAELLNKVSEPQETLETALSEALS